jgi:hypothetical protein
MKIKMIKKFWRLAALIAALGLGACEEEEKNTASLEVSATDLFLDVHGLNENEEPVMLNITTTAAWSAHCASWITITPSAGAIGTTQVVVTAGSTDEERTGYITFRSGNQQKVITVSQVTYESVETELAVAPETISVFSDGLLSAGTAPAITITSNKTWAISGYPDWIIPDNVAGSAGESAITFEVSAHTVTAEDRSATLTVTAGVQSKTVVLTQRKHPSLSVTPATIEVLFSGLLASDGTMPVLAVTANETWTLNSNASWVTPSSTTGNPGNAIPVTLDIAQHNSTTEDRSATVTVTLANLSETVLITQEKKNPMLIPSAGTLTLRHDGLMNDGSTPALNLTSTSAWTATTTDAWIHITTDSGPEGTVEIPFTVDKNTTTATRNGMIALTNDNGLDTTVAVVQIPLDDEKSVGHVYFEDDFDWVIPFGGPPDIEEYNETGDAVVTATLNMYTYATGVPRGALAAEFVEQGYTDINPTTQSVYFASHYLKFGKSNVQTGIQRTIPITSGRYANVTLTFDATPCITGNKNYDKVLLIVEIDGPGAVSVDDGSTKRSAELDIQLVDKSPVWEWKTKSVVLYGITSATKITIKTNKSGDETGTFRYYFDNLKFEKHSVVTP